MQTQCKCVTCRCSSVQRGNKYLKERKKGDNPLRIYHCPRQEKNMEGNHCISLPHFFFYHSDLFLKLGGGSSLGACFSFLNHPGFNTTQNHPHRTVWAVPLTRPQSCNHQPDHSRNVPRLKLLLSSLLQTRGQEVSASANKKMNIYFRSHKRITRRLEGGELGGCAQKPEAYH